jgi:hypothetical protein
MVSYFKTQWFRLLVAFVCLGISIYYAFQPAAETLTVETLDAMMSDMLTAIGYFFSFLIWITISCIDFNSDRIELLEKKAEKYDALVEKVDALTKLQETSDKLTDQRLKKLEGRR